MFSAICYGQDTQRNEEIKGFTLYPNPVTTGKLYIKTDLNAAKNIQIYDVFGKQLLETTILGKELNLNDIPAGVYVLRVTEKDKVATRKLVIK